MNFDTLPVAVIGAGPVGLAAAAHLLSRGIKPLVLESGNAVGANLRSFAQVQLFSPWRYNVDKAARALLEQHGWHAPADDVLPTAGEVLSEYLKPLERQLTGYLHFNHRVTAIARHGVDKVKTASRENAPFTVRATAPEGEREFIVRAVIDASGTWNQPNPLGANGLPALGERDLQEHISYGMPDILGADRSRYAGKRVLVVGAGHSAAGNLIALAQLADEVPTTQIFWAIRGDNWTRIFGGGANDGLPARGELGQRLKRLHSGGRLQVFASFRIEELRRENARITVLGVPGGAGRSRISGIEEIIAATGARPDLSITRELRTRWDHWLESTEALAPLIDPNEHSCGTVRPHGHRELAHPEIGYYAIGAKSYGRAPTFLLATGYEQARSVVAAIAGDVKAADEVELDLPQTGVCNVSFAAAPATEEEAGCCGGPPKANAEACCVADEQAKAEGEAACGCGPKVQALPTPRVAPRACCG